MKHPKAAMLCSLLLSGSTLACKPNVGAPISLISGPAILAVKGQPAEAKPGATVTYEVLAVDSTGRIPSPGGDVTAPAQWAICEQPKPPIETNSVSAACLDTAAWPGQPGATADTYTAPMPADACQQFGPITPQPQPGQPPVRPRDPDVTDGYYLPVRVGLDIPPDLQRAGMASADAIVAFGLERISCGLANAPSDPVREFTKNYTINVNPTIDQLTWQQGGGVPAPVPRLETAAPVVVVQSGQTVTFSLSWTPDSVETYPAYDVLTRTLKYHREAMRAAWYATAGSFEHDVSGRTEDETDVFAENIWTPGPVGLVYLWVVLHDSRGGTDFASFAVQVQ